MALDKLCDLTARLMNGAEPLDSVPNLILRKTELETGYEAVMYEPMLYFVLQGAKQLSVGGQTLTYGASNFLVLSVDLPANARVKEASSTKPFLGIEIRISREIAGDSIVEMLPPLPFDSSKAFAVGSASPEALDALLRLTRLLEVPQDARQLAPLYMRELLYRVGQGPHGHLLWHALRLGSHFAQIQRAIDWIKVNFREKIRIDALAEISGMSVTSFHRYFKAVTNLTPGAYHKVVRLHHARRLLLEAPTVSSVAFSVGYESAAQFSREYAVQFGTSPRQDASRLKTGLRS